MRYVLYRWARGDDPRERKIDREEPDTIKKDHVFGCFIVNLFQPEDEFVGRERVPGKS